MSQREVAQQANASLSLARSQDGMLLRKCACGQHTIGGRQCAECGKNENSLQHEATNHKASAASFPPPGIPLMQRKVMIGTANDPLEQEADRVALMLLAAPSNPAVSGATTQIQRHAGPATRQAGKVPVNVERVLASVGQPLNPALQTDMEWRFGRDFSRVRVHTDPAAEQSARAVNANAYTMGHDIVFGAGRFSPETHEGRRLIAHELVHIVQQSSSDAIRLGHDDEKPGLSAPAGVSPALSIGARLSLDTRSSVYIARQPTPGSEPATAPEEETVEEVPPKDKWKGTRVSEIVISLARKRVGFRIPQGMLLGTVDTDLAAGTYEIKAVPAKQQWIILGENVEKGLRFDVDLSESYADPWTLSYPEKLTLTVGAGALGEPKTFGEMIDEQGQFKDPLGMYEGWGGNVGPAQPVSGIDDYETIELVKETVTPSEKKEKVPPARYRVKYRDQTERLLTYVELTPKMRKQLAPMFEKADEEFLMFTLETFPMWWSIVSITPLAPMTGAGARPYIPKRIPLAPQAPQQQRPSLARVPLQRPAAGLPPEPQQQPSPPGRVPLQRPAAGQAPEPPGKGPAPSGAAAAVAAEEAVVVSQIQASQGPGVAYGKQAAARLAAQGKTAQKILGPLAEELNAQPNMSPMDKATAIRVACNQQGTTWGAGPIAEMGNGNLVVTPRAANPSAHVMIVQPNGTVVRGTASIEQLENAAVRVSNVTIKQ
jgi:uncharacterized protein DUF4157